ncbi:MAG: hypothetical protein JGK13_26725 [Microcoleus sp. PH2017_37_MFU_D_B]|nr:hypothetical protein [Microcoleus sp. PH2017_37_MFU_D_B]
MGAWKSGGWKSGGWKPGGWKSGGWKPGGWKPGGWKPRLHRQNPPPRVEEKAVKLPPIKYPRKNPVSGHPPTIQGG